MSDTIISIGNVDKHKAKETDWLRLINIGKLSAEEQRDLWNNRSFYRNNSAEVNVLLVAEFNRQKAAGRKRVIELATAKNTDESVLAKP